MGSEPCISAPALRCSSKRSTVRMTSFQGRPAACAEWQGLKPPAQQASLLMLYAAFEGSGSSPQQQVAVLSSRHSDCCMAGGSRSSQTGFAWCSLLFSSALTEVKP